jgi:hypothetical protein
MQASKVLETKEVIPGVPTKPPAVARAGDGGASFTDCLHCQAVHLVAAGDRLAAQG